MKRHIIFIPGFLISAFILCSCLEELEHTDKIESTSFEPMFEFPLVNSNFTMEEFLTEGKSKAKISEQNGLMVLTYDDSLSTPSGSSFFTVPDQQSPVLSITGPEVSLPAGSSVTITKDLTFTFSTLGSLDSLLIKAGQMAFDVSSDFPADIDLTIDIPSLKIGGIPYQKNFSFSGAGIQNPVEDLASSTFDLTYDGTMTNTVSFSITATITDTGQPIDNSNHLDFSFGMTDLQFSGLFGDLGNISFSLADSVNVDLFDFASNGEVKLLEPVIQLTLDNSFGLPVGLEVQEMSAIKDNATISLAGDFINENPHILAAPDYTQVGQEVSSEIRLDSDNSNIADLISSLPQYFSYKYGLSLNPPPSSTENFVLDSSHVDIGLHLELPFYGSVSGLEISREYDFNGLGIDDVGQSKVKVTTVNETPLEASIQVYFLDAAGDTLETLFDDPSILKGAPVDADGFTQDASEVVTEISITQEKIDRIESAESMLIGAMISTTNNGTVPVKFSASDAIRISIGVNTRVKYNTN